MGMMAVNVADIALLNGGSIYTVQKMYKIKGRLKDATYYFRKKEDALDTIMSAINCTSMGDDNLIYMVYHRYDDQGIAQEYLVLYDKDRRYEDD